RVADAARSILNLWVQKWTGGLWMDKQRKKLSHARKTLRSLGTPRLSSGHARHRRMGRELRRRRGHGMALQAEGRSTALGGARGHSRCLGARLGARKAIESSHHGTRACRVPRD